MEILRVENLCKEYGKGQTKVKALDNVSFSVEKGEFVAIVGASGSGKSTLLHLLGGVDRPNSGKLTKIIKIRCKLSTIYKQRSESRRNNPKCSKKCIKYM